MGKTAIVTGGTKNDVAAMGVLALNIRDIAPGLADELIIFHDGISAGDQALIRQIMPTRFYRFDFHISFMDKRKNSYVRYFSPMIFCKYECFRLLEQYDRVIWTDYDVVIRKNMQELLNSDAGLQLIENGEGAVKDWFKDQGNSISGEYDIERVGVTAPLLVMTRNIGDYMKYYHWCRQATHKYIAYIEMPEQCILSLLIQKFHITYQKLPVTQYAPHPWDHMKDASIVHAYGRPKFWEGLHDEQWDGYYAQWVAMGGHRYTISAKTRKMAQERINFMESKGKEKVYAPVAVFVYKRTEQTKKIFEALKDNELAKESDIFIFADGAKGEKDKEQVDAVRAYIRSLEGRGWFHSVTIKESKKNIGIADSIIGGVNQIIKRYGKVIVLEDDLITSSQYLSYMNTCLDYFESDQRIWAVCGYTPDLKSLKDYNRNTYLSYRAFAWGWGTWKDRWLTIDWDVKDYRQFCLNPWRRFRFRFGGNDMFSMLKAQMHGKIDAWDIRWCYAQSKAGKLAVMPRESLVQNIGFDGTGTHSTVEDGNKFTVKKLSNEKIQWTKDNLKVNPKIVYDIYKLYRLTIVIRIRDKIREIRSSRM